LPQGRLSQKIIKWRPSLNLNKLLQLERGHWLEYGVEKAFSAIGLNLLSQLEISINYQNGPIKANLFWILKARKMGVSGWFQRSS
jgi:hypothetical protein